MKRLLTTLLVLFGLAGAAARAAEECVGVWHQRELTAGAAADLFLVLAKDGGGRMLRDALDVPLHWRAAGKNSAILIADADGSEILPAGAPILLLVRGDRAELTSRDGAETRPFSRLMFEAPFLPAASDEALARLRRQLLEKSAPDTKRLETLEGIWNNGREDAAARVLALNETGNGFWSNTSGRALVSWKYVPGGANVQLLNDQLQPTGMLQLRRTSDPDTLQLLIPGSPAAAGAAAAPVQENYRRVSLHPPPDWEDRLKPPPAATAPAAKTPSDEPRHPGFYQQRNK